MATVLGKNLRSRKVISSSGSELGNVLDLFFEDSGKIVSLIVKPERETTEIRDYLDKNRLLEVPYEHVRSIGRYVVIDFPFSK